MRDVLMYGVYPTVNSFVTYAVEDRREKQREKVFSKKNSSAEENLDFSKILDRELRTIAGI